MKKLVILLLAIVTASCLEEVNIEQPDHLFSEDFSQHPHHSTYYQELVDYRSATNAPGVIMLVKKCDEDLWIGAFGKSNLALQTNMTTATPFRIGSITKIFTATVVMRLLEQDKLSLEQSLASLLPEVQEKIPHANKITLQHLLSHLSGIVDPPNQNIQYQLELVNSPTKVDQMSVDDRLQKYVYGKELLFTPGTSYSYSNANYWLVGKIIERLEGRLLQEVMFEYLFQPLQLEDTYLEERDDRNVARGYADLYGNGKLLDVGLLDKANTDGLADGGIISTASDLMVFFSALFEGNLLTASSLETMKEMQLASCNSPECEYGLGLEIWKFGSGEPITAWGHNGGSVGIEANALYFDEQGAIIVLYKNNGHGSDKSLLERLIRHP